MIILEILEINLLFQDKLTNHLFQDNEIQPIIHLLKAEQKADQICLKTRQ